MTTTREFLLERIAKERMNQLAKWGDQTHDLPGWITIATEELGEAAKHACENLDGHFSINNAEYILNQFMYEMIQTAAVCVAACEDAQRKYDSLERPRDLI